MIRLAVHGAQDSRLQEVACRLRGATLEIAPNLTCDAAAFFNPPLHEMEPYLQAGKPVLVAMESGLTIETLRALTGLPNEARAPLVIANADRYLPSRQLIRQHLDKLGAPGLIRIHRWQPGEPTPVRGRRIQPDALMRDLDLILWYVGTNPSVVYAVAHASGTQIHLGFPNGGMALIDHASVPPGESYYSLSLICANGAAYADDHQNMQLAYCGASPRAVRAPEGVQWSTLVQDFVDAIQTGCDGPFKQPTWQPAIILAEAVETSLRTGQAVNLGEPGA